MRVWAAEAATTEGITTITMVQAITVTEAMGITTMIWMMITDTGMMIGGDGPDQIIGLHTTTATTTTVKTDVAHSTAKGPAMIMTEKGRDDRTI